MCSGVETPKRRSSILVNKSFDIFAHEVISDSSIQIMKEAFTNLFDIVDIVFLLINHENSEIVGLAAWSRIESTSIEKYNIFSFLFVLYVLKNTHNFGIEDI